MAEWSIAVVLKTIEPKGSGGSNPSLSATCKARAKRIAWDEERSSTKRSEDGECNEKSLSFRGS